MMTDTVVLVPLDGAKTAHCALPVARRIAGLGKGVRKGAIRILHVTRAAGPPGEIARQLGLQPVDLADATLEVRAGDPGQAILAAAADCAAGLIVMGADSAGAPPAGAIGKAALAVLRGAHCSVVLLDPARTPEGWSLRRVLALHDGSPTISSALGPATALVRDAGAELVVLQVAQDARILEAGSIAPPAYVDQVQHSWPGWSAEFLHRLHSVSPIADVPVRLLVAHGEPADETVRVAGEVSADLIVLAWTGRGEDAAILQAVARDAPCPVMVTRVPDS